MIFRPLCSSAISESIILVAHALLQCRSISLMRKMHRTFFILHQPCFRQHETANTKPYQCNIGGMSQFYIAKNLIRLRCRITQQAAHHNNIIKFLRGSKNFMSHNSNTATGFNRPNVRRNNLPMTMDLTAKISIISNMQQGINKAYKSKKCEFGRENKPNSNARFYIWRLWRFC